jgi:hypothetical protein
MFAQPTSLVAFDETEHLHLIFGRFGIHTYIWNTYIHLEYMNVQQGSSSAKDLLGEVNPGTK